MDKAKIQEIIDKAIKDSGLREKLAAMTPEERQTAINIFTNMRVMKIIAKHVWKYVKEQKENHGI